MAIGMSRTTLAIIAADLGAAALYFCALRC